MGRKNPPSQSRGGKGKGNRRYPDSAGVSRRDRFGDTDNMIRPDSAVDERDQARDDDSEEDGTENEDTSGTRILLS